MRFFKEHNIFVEILMLFDNGGLADESCAALADYLKWTGDE
jgi:hypothetical protein